MGLSGLAEVAPIAAFTGIVRSLSKAVARPSPAPDRPTVTHKRLSIRLGSTVHLTPDARGLLDTYRSASSPNEQLHDPRPECGHAEALQVDVEVSALRHEVDHLDPV